MPAERLRVIVAGATGYTGGELVRLLAEHPAVDIRAFVSATSPGEPVADKLPHWRGRAPALFEPLDNLPALDADVVFFATPHAVAMQHAPALLDAGRVVIDLGADFRLQDTTVFEQWYGAHSAPQLLPQAVYGLSEAARDALKTAALIACPGCYATAVETALLPFVAGGHIDGDVIADAKSGTSGAGRQSNRPELLLAEMAGNYKPYALTGHRHHAEIMQTLAATGQPAPPLIFVPHLLPIARGLFVNLHFKLRGNVDASQLLAEYWRDEPFIDVLPPPMVAELAQAVGTNRVLLSAHAMGDNRIMICSALDNLLKGAAGQAVQNMNIRFALPETTALPGALPQ